MTRRTREEIEEMRRALEESKRPKVQRKKNFSAYIPPDILERIRATAKRERRSVNGQICFILGRYFEEIDGKPRPEA